MAQATKVTSIQGEHTTANRLSFSKPRIAMAVKANPNRKAMTVQPALEGSRSFRPGDGSPNRAATEVADTEIMAPASTQ